jgi:hypothetical protein
MRYRSGVGALALVAATGNRRKWSGTRTSGHGVYLSGTANGPIPPNSRFNVPIVESFFTGVSGQRYGAVVESVGAQPARIVVERATYWDAQGRIWAAGSAALATKLQ